MKNLRLVVINTTAFSEENLTIITDLTDEQILDVLTPIVEVERNGGDEYYNDDLVTALHDNYYLTNFIQEVGGGDILTI
jgi:hypothetical protein